MSPDFETIESRKVYAGSIFDVFSDQVRLPNGNVAERSVIRHAGAVTILPVGADGTIYLIEQFRYPAGGMILELPAGTLEKGEGRDECAARELTEETGLRAGNMERLMTFYLCPGYSDERITLYRATDLKKADMNLDENEIITVVPAALEDAIAMIADGRIIDGKTIVALYYEKILRNG